VEADALEPVWAVVAGRMGSSRHRGKTMADLAGRPVLAHVVERLRATTGLDGVCVATTTAAEDDPIRSWARQAGVPCHAGSVDDVLTRVLEAARRMGARTVVRVTGDCPLIDPRVVAEALEAFRRERPDYVSNRLRGYTYPDGYDVEVVATAALGEVQRSTSEPFDREHVTPFIYRHPERFRLLGVEAQGRLRRPDLHLSVDHEEDLTLVRAVVEALEPTNPLFGVGDVIEFLDAHPEIAALNRDVPR
jgi:spore coat polysaccharide biosynthesis protein SpsF